MEELFDTVSEAPIEKAARESLGGLLNSFPRYAGGNGVQMPGPDIAAHEANFDAIGEDMHWQAPMTVPPAGVRLPGDPNAENGWLTGEDMTNQASGDPIPQGMDMGVEGGADDMHGIEDEASSAGFHNTHSFDEMFGGIPGRQHPTSIGVGPAMAGLPLGSISNQGYPGIGIDARGIDSMQGLDLGWMPAPRGEQDVAARESSSMDGDETSRAY